MFDDWSEWDGYDDPTYTQISNRALDFVMSRVSGPEWKVFCYILRRTYGFRGREYDDISLNQICDGIKRGDVVLDTGTGLARSTAQQAIQGLIDKGLILADRMQDERGGNAPTRYRVRRKNDAGTLYRESAQGGRESAQVYRNPYPQKKETKEESNGNTAEALPPNPRSDPPLTAFVPDRAPIENNEQSLSATTPQVAQRRVKPQDNRDWSEITRSTVSGSDNRDWSDITRGTQPHPTLEKTSLQPMASPSENQSQQRRVPPGMNPWTAERLPEMESANDPKPWLRRRATDAPQTTTRARQAPQKPKVRQHTAPKKSAPRINAGDGAKSAGPNRFGQFIDAVKAQGGAYATVSRDPKAVMDSAIDPTDLATMYCTIQRGEYGGSFALENLSARFCCERYNGYAAWNMQGRPKPGNGQSKSGGTQQGRPGDRYRMGGQLDPSEYENIGRMKARQRARRAEIEAELAGEE